ncbi:hypothetical protein [Pantoea phytobeneficialis]|uniref:Uncharacterized protein n=1 Tax=Pantoea phytobeneficialis TaxID=2052056 RepID=A0AAP9KP58_9GAMM|nr:hypothetical protein [Pantoea phytobeneficialis]MDO6406134.1 hypothetical protein [Pantoea phytobeneficialis]QGR06554.1 hypothetical protein CTZ24_09075 [Pantoea phytobeneficialis]
MILFAKVMSLIFAGLLVAQPGGAIAAPVRTVEKVIQQGLPDQPDALLKVSRALFDDYQQHHEAVALIFHSYALLRLANHFEAVNDYVNASEYAKLGFFYLDEAVDTHETNFRLRYLRARVDAYLPAKLGRCVVTLQDTEILLRQAKAFDAAIQAQINVMRYRALSSCRDHTRANALLTAMQNGTLSERKLLALGTDSTPEWDAHELAQILMPLVKGE